MGGKKKKSLANRLAKMSDEERGKYLQRKAEQEEEAKKRKEQLISTFMKNKIKREDAFSRLNLAKINQNWHQILRAKKCQEMKEDVMHMKNCLERVLAYKNRTIENLLEELEMSEEQYSYNFQSHSTHIERIIDAHSDYLGSMHDQFKTDLNETIQSSEIEIKEIVEYAENEKTYLQTLIYELELKRDKDYKENYDSYMKRHSELVSTCQMELEKLKRSREASINAIWRQIASMIRSYVEQTDSRRLHLAELKRLDGDSAVEIATNQERITKQEEEEAFLTSQLELSIEKREKHITLLEEERKTLQTSLLKSKQRLKFEIDFDEDLLKFLSTKSSLVVKNLEELHERGKHLLDLMRICQKFETQREKTFKFLSPATFRLFPFHSDDDKLDELQVTRPKTTCSTPPTKEQIETIRNVFINPKLTAQPSAPTSPITNVSSDVDKCIESLQLMEMFWNIYNKVELDFEELKEEKKVLLQQNKQLRGMIRAVLEAATLSSKSLLNSKVSTRVASKNRSAYSAPLRRVLF